MVFPHLLVTIATRSNAGLLTGLLLAVPASTAFLRRAFAAGQLRAERLLIMAGALISAILLSIPSLFKTGACDWMAATQKSHLDTESY